MKRVAVPVRFELRRKRRGKCVGAGCSLCSGPMSGRYVHASLKLELEPGFKVVPAWFGPCLGCAKAIGVAAGRAQR